MPYEIETRDGIVIRNIPDNVSPDSAELKARVQQERQAKMQPSAEDRAMADPTKDMPQWERAAAGFGKAIVDTGRGLKGLFAMAADAVAPRQQTLSDLVTGENNSRNDEIRKEVIESRQRDKALMDTGAGFAGNLAGNVGMALAPGGILKGASVLSRGAQATRAAAPVLDAMGSAALVPRNLSTAVGVGAGLGMAQPAENATERVVNTLLGGGVSGAAMAIPKAVGRVLNPQTTPEVKDLMSAGVTLTPGQILGGTAKRVEEGATSIPVIGDSIKAAQRRGVEDFNKAAINRVTDVLNRVPGSTGQSMTVAGSSLPTFQKVTKAGYEGIEQIGEAVGRAYYDLLPKLKVVADGQFGQELGVIRQMAGNMPPERAAQFDKILENEVLGAFTPQGRMMGETMKQVESKLGKFIRDYGRSQDADQRLLGDALKETQAALRRMVERNNPQFAGELSKINEAYANLLRVENAAARQGSKEGVFSPAALRSSTRQMDSSLRKRAFARGDALMQDLADAGEKVLGPTVPDSGTPLRLMTSGGALAGGYLLDPMVAGTALGAAGLYTKPAQKIIEALLARRPDLVRQAGTAVGNAAPALTAASLPLIGAINANQ